MSYYYKFLTLCTMLIISAGASASTSDTWRVNNWGATPPTAIFLKKDLTCLRAQETTSSFQIVSRGSGDAELVFSKTLNKGDAYRFTVWLASEIPQQVDVFFRRNTFPYDTTTIRSKTVSGWSQLDLSGIHASSGPGSVRIALKDERKTLCISSPLLVSIEQSSVGSSAAASYIDASFFGIHLNHLGRHNEWPQFDPGTLRLWDTGTTWALLQPENLPIDWQRNPYARRLDFYIRHGSTKHKNVQFIYTMGMTPKWAGVSHSSECKKSPYGPSACTRPSDIESWRKHIRDLGYRYRGLIQVWEIWNEADLWYQWDQGPEALVQLVKVAKEELKSIDSQNKIIGPNITGGGLQFLNRFFQAGGGSYLDGVSIHSYLGRAPSLAAAQLRNLRQMLRYYGMESMPIWNTESGVPCNTFLEDCSKFHISRQEVLSGETALAQGLVANAALGIKTFVYYTWEGAGTANGNLPLVDSAYRTPTNAGLVLSTIKEWLIGSYVKYLKIDKDGLNVVEIDQHGARSYILWSSGEERSVDITEFGPANRYTFVGNPNSIYPLMAGRLNVGSEPVKAFSEQ